MKGIILAGGKGTRLSPLTASISKQMLPIYNKPMVYYPLDTLLSAGIDDILLISTSRDLPLYKGLLGDRVKYAVQDKANGLAEAFIIGADFVGNDSVTLILGDNFFHSYDLSNCMKRAIERTESGKSTIFGVQVVEPKAYGVVEFNIKGEVISIEEKPEFPKSNYAVPGLYVYTNDVVEIAKTIKPSSRGELEITDLNNVFLENGDLFVEILQEVAWFDCGTFDSLLEVGNYVHAYEKRTGKSILKNF